MKQQLTPTDLNIGLSLNTNILNLTILHLSRCLILFLTLFYRVNVCLIQQWKAILRQKKGTGSLSYTGA
jgi:hypothetical protein